MTTQHDEAVVRTTDPMERLIEAALLKSGIRYETETENDANLDFHLPDHGVHIEVKRFHSDRIGAQMARAENVIAAQGKTAVEFLASLLSAGSVGGDMVLMRTALERCAQIVERNLYRQHEKIEDVPKIAIAAISATAAPAGEVERIREALRYCADAPLSGWTIAQGVARAALSNDKEAR